MAATDDATLNAARDRARVALAKLAPHFGNGVPDLERLLVKGPFTTNSGQIEWMWVEVSRWDGDTLSGVLVNEPFQPSSVTAGDHVSVKLGDTFDYTWQKRDGTVEGGETDAILERSGR
jgi:uncharacterized protein YegJ (DUF2314 family)